MTDFEWIEAITAKAQAACHPRGRGRLTQLNDITAALPVIATEVLAPIEALHRPVHLVFSWHAPLRKEDPCPTCHGKAGTWECGCWSEYDRHIYCAECSATDTSHTVTVDWPCPTAQAVAAIREAVRA